MNLDELAVECHKIARDHGFWDHELQGSIHGEKIALMHSELSEALDAMRKNNGDSVPEELADTIIRILDYCGFMGFHIHEAVMNKIEKNKARPRLHGRAF